jgi:hypothetical protein
MVVLEYSWRAGNARIPAPPGGFAPHPPTFSRVEFLGEMSDVLHSRALLPLIGENGEQSGDARLPLREYAPHPLGASPTRGEGGVWAS